MKRIDFMVAMNSYERLPLDSDLLTTFLAVAETGNVTHAGHAVGRTQSAVSVQIRKLEDALGVRLFDRQARGVVLTENGQDLVPAARRALGEINRIGRMFKERLTGRIRVGIPDDYGVSVLERVLARFSARHPGVEVSVRCGFSVGFPEAVQRGTLDLAVHTASPGEETGTLLMTERTVWAAAREWRADPEIPPPLALFDRQCWWRDAAIDALNRAGMRYRIAYSSESVAGVKAAIAAGLAVGVLNAGTLGDGLRALTPEDGFPSLPDSALRLICADGLDPAIGQAMEAAIKDALSG